MKPSAKTALQRLFAKDESWYKFWRLRRLTPNRTLDQRIDEFLKRQGRPVPSKKSDPWEGYSGWHVDFLDCGRQIKRAPGSDDLTGRKRQEEG